jgi:hypothetical protein
MERSDERLTTDDLASGRREPEEREPTIARELADDTRDRPTETESASAQPDTDQRREPVASEARSEAGGAEPSDGQPLLAPEQANDFKARWEEIQTGFVDEPRRSVEQADALVADLMQRLAESFSEERRSLEAQWDRGDDVSTEDLRVALRRYRSFFDRLLSA